MIPEQPFGARPFRPSVRPTPTCTDIARPRPARGALIPPALAGS
jgi:hypothetical protein